MHVSYRSACNTWCMEPSEPAVHLFIPHPHTKGIWFGQGIHVSILISSYLEVPLGVMAFLQSVLVCWWHCLSLYLLASTWLPGLGLIREPLLDLQGPMPCSSTSCPAVHAAPKKPRILWFKRSSHTRGYLMCHFIPESPEFGDTVILQLSLLPYTNTY